MEAKIPNNNNSLTESQEIHKKAREELERQLQGLLNNQPIENPTEENIEDEVNRLMEEVDFYEKNYIPKDLDENEYNELKKFEKNFQLDDMDDSIDNSDDSEKNNNINIDNIKENKEKNEIIINKDKPIDSKKDNKKIKKKKKKKSKLDLEMNLKEIDTMIKKSNKSSKKKNYEDIEYDKEIKALYEEYEKQLDIEVAQEVEKEFKQKLDMKDIKRAELLLKVDPLINEAVNQGIIKKENLVLFIDYYEIFSLTNKAKKFTSDQLKAIDDLCIKNNKQQKEINNDDDNDKNKKNNEKYDLNDENAIDKLTNEIEKGLQDSEDIIMKKIDYEKYMMELNQNKNKKNNDKVEINKNNSDKNLINKNNISTSSSKTIKTNYTVDNITENKDTKRPLSTNSEKSNFTKEELMSVPKYSLHAKEQNNKNKKISEENNSNLTTKTFYNDNNININKDNININIQSQKPKTPLNPFVKNKRNNQINGINSSLSIPSGKKIIPPIKKPKIINSTNLKSKTNQNVDLFDDNANPINMGKYRGARKDLVKLKMGGKSKVHELFVNKPRNVEENEIIKQKFMEFIKTGKENNKIQDSNGNKKSIVRKKIEDAQKFNKSNK